MKIDFLAPPPGAVCHAPAANRVKSRQGWTCRPASQIRDSLGRHRQAKPPQTRLVKPETAGALRPAFNAF